MASAATNFSLSLRTKQQTPISKPSFFFYSTNNNNHLRFKSNHFPSHSVSTARNSRICATSSPVMDPSAAKSEPILPTTVEVDLGNRSYPIYIGSGLLDQPDYLQRSYTTRELTGT
ncbi:3-dehydroquinate synthase [Vigna unguiculata]|uniref:3-dehydroquinate synthase n=1 Tax=Vigna unguiculata TaxID=3917 RepID=A0A4D6LRK4_VIGUN|nr:3-dehydroquinate synthase [Vigna unguiculata]